MDCLLEARAKKPEGSGTRGKYANRRWLWLLPVIFVTYSLAYLDRANYSFGAAAGMAKDLNISANASTWLGALFFLGYFAFQVPGTLWAQRHSVRKLIFFGLIAWGALAASIGVLTDLRALIAVRFLLGVVESAVLPALLILVARWFTKSERARVSSILIQGNPVTVTWMSVLSGYLASSFGWRNMFIAEGLPPILWAFVWWRLVDDRPCEASWLPADDRAQTGSATGGRTARHSRGAKSARGVDLAAGAGAGAAIFLLERRALWLRAVAAHPSCAAMAMAWWRLAGSPRRHTRCRRW